ncbi:hypothetical protein AJ79_03644 [Helicocarpus griseus UAMH5409]|uniref:Uncharacterized protein n=1 Tax=Helicocarpus griseus UAMH5409 TaxID=1447875 RepID=A0A2B7XXK5_9EURO|nr:hypothetical protein AJ79_03644 [Helicocarpus griseus UAMH5409]
METTMPLILTETERQHVLAQEYLSNITSLTTAGLQSDPSTHGSSGSKWGVKEVNAVRAVPLVDLDPKRIVPEKYFPGDNNPGKLIEVAPFARHICTHTDNFIGFGVFISLRRFIRAAKIDDLKEYDDEKFSDNPFDTLFDDLGTLITTHTSEKSIGNVHRGNMGGDSVDTELSTSGNGGKSQTLSSHALKAFVSTTLKKMGDYKRLTNVGPDGPYLRCAMDENRFQWNMAGVTHVAVNDGSIIVNFRGSLSGSDRSSDAPVCKPRDAGGVKRRSGEPEAFIPAVLAQEVAELIGGMVAQRSKLPIKHSDQELFVLSMHATLFYITVAYFSPEYIRYIETPNLPRPILTR